MYIKYTLSSQRHNFTTFLPAEIILLLLRQSSHILASEYENDTLCIKMSNEGSDEPVPVQARPNIQCSHMYNMIDVHKGNDI